MKIRRALPQDIPAISAMHDASIREICSSRYTPNQIDEWIGALSLEGYTRAMETLDFIVAKDDGIVGLSIFDAQRAELTALYVAPARTGQGVGKTLLREIETMAREGGVFELFLNSTLNAVTFYEHMGFSRGRVSSYTLPSGRVLPCVEMSKLIGRHLKHPS